MQMTPASFGPMMRHMELPGERRPVGRGRLPNRWHLRRGSVRAPNLPWLHHHRSKEGSR